MSSDSMSQWCDDPEIKRIPGDVYAFVALMALLAGGLVYGIVMMLLPG